jgi:hypothetical protein
MAKPKQFAVCVKNDGAEESLELRKIYELLEDPAAEKRKFVRVVDEEGEDYLYPKSWFLPIELSKPVERAIVELSHS